MPVMNISNRFRFCGLVALCFILPFTAFGNNGVGGGPPKAWGTAVLIETDDAGDAVIPKIAMATNGNAMAVWQQNDGTRNNIVAAHFDGIVGVWGAPELIETDNVGGAGIPHISMDANGNAIAAWYQYDGTRWNIVANRYDADTGKWGTAELIETDNAGNALISHIAMDANGNAIVLWRQNDGIRWNVVTNRYDATVGAWGTAELIETDNLGNVSNPRIAMDGNGNAIAVWRQNDGSRWNIVANRYDATMKIWSGAEIIEIDNAGNAYGPKIAMDTNGNAIAVWPQSDGTRWNIAANRYNVSTGAWGIDVLIETDNTGNAQQPDIAFDADGNAVAVWMQAASTYYDLASSRYYATTDTWGSAMPIEVGDTGSAQAPRIAFDTNGDAMVVWQKYEGISSNIWAKRFTARKGAWGVAELIETDNTGDAVAAQIAIDANGNSIAMWYQYDGVRWNIVTNRYESKSRPTNKNSVSK